MTIATKCTTSIFEQVKGDLKREQVKKVVEELFEMGQRNPDLTKSVAQRLALSARNLTEAELLRARMTKRGQAINILRRKEAEGRLDLGAAEGRTASTELSRMNVGSPGGGTKAGLSLDAQAHDLEGAWIGGMVSDLRRANVLDYFTGSGFIRRRDPEFEKLVAREMSRLNGGPEKVTGNPHALAVAEAINKYGEGARVARNEAGAYIGKRKGFIASQTHNPATIATAAGASPLLKAADHRAAWKAFIFPKLDSATFEGVANPDKFLDEVWANLATGNHLDPPGTKPTRDSGLYAATGPGNLSSRLSQQRVLHFKGADDWFAYNERFGMGNVFDGALFNLRRAARDTATMRTWGVNPEAMFQSVAESAMQKAKAAGDIKEVARLETAMKGRAGLTPGLYSEFAAATGVGDIPGNPRAAEIMQTVRNITSMAKLGGMLLSNISDLAYRAATLRHNGVGLLEGFTDGLQSLARGRGSAELQNAMNTLGVGLDGITGAVLSRFSSADGVPGRATKMMGNFFRLNGAAWWQDALMTGSGRMLSKNLGDQATLAFDQLPRRLQTNLRRYGIDAADWETIRTTPLLDVDGAKLLLPEHADDAVRDRLQTYFVDQARESMTMGGAAERAWITQFGPPGSLAGETARTVMQFKSFSMTYLRRHLGRELRRDQVDGWGLAFLITASTVLGYGSMVAKDLAKGRTPRDPRSVGTWTAALTQGGGAGIFGDYLLGQYNRFGGGLAETLAGPAVSTVADWAKIFAQIKDAGMGGADTLTTGAPYKGPKGSAILSDTVRTAVNSTPFANLFYTRAALDYLVLYQVQEWLDPGSLKRMERKVEQENNQTFILKPSNVVPRGGGVPNF